ncbi:MAG: SnoaL-like polyketide cyclase [Thermomicrobiales bacterium]|nr:SnoaL-like polyketide cyclase [Thermomicrobiales bacterium]
MRRSLLLTTVVLALATAGVLTSAAWLLPMDATVETPATGEDVARRFYDAVNVAIATGEVAPLRAVVAPEFVATDALPPVRPGRAGLEAALADLHANSPALRLKPEAVVADGGRVMVRVAVAGDRGDGFLGVPLVAVPRPWGAVDVLRVVDGKVAERRGLLEGAGLLRALGSAPLALTGPARRVVTLDRVVLAPGERYDGDAFLADHALQVETGGIRVAFTEPASPRLATVVAEPQGAETAITLPPGEVIVVPEDHRYTTTNTGTTDAVLVRLSIALPQVGGAAMDADATAETVGPGSQKLAGGVAMRLPDGPLKVAVGRVVLGPGATLSLGEGNYGALLSVDTGTLGGCLTHTGSIHRGTNGARDAAQSARLGPGDGLAIDPGTSLVLRNDGSSTAEALIVAVVASAR